MAGRGPAPKPAGQKVRRNADPVPTQVVAPDDQVRGPELPASMAWPEQTVKWWTTWRTAPQAKTFTSSDWDFLLDTALLHAELWAGNGAVAAELRLRVAKFGATPEDRLRLRMQIETEQDAAKAATATNMTKQRRERLLKVVASDNG